MIFTNCADLRQRQLIQLRSSMASDFLRSSALEIRACPIFQAHKLSGGHTAGVTPVPIPNTEVKPRRADDTARVTVWERRSPPDLIPRAPIRSPNWSPFYFSARLWISECFANTGKCPVRPGSRSREIRHWVRLPNRPVATVESVLFVETPNLFNLLRRAPDLGLSQ